MTSLLRTKNKMVTSSLTSLIFKKIIKPSVPTPLTLRSHKLSFVDQAFNFSIPIAFFFPKSRNDKSYEPSDVSQILEKSLSKALSLYYPYAGRLMKDGSSVDCNDMGVELSHVRVHCPMSEILKNSNTDVDHDVFPVARPYGHNEVNLATTQVSHFDCGGITIAGCISHMIGDGNTASNFFNSWGVLSRDKSATVPSPYFIGDSIYPLRKDYSVESPVKLEEPEGLYLGKRFVFSAAKVKDLKAMFSSDSGVENPTRTEVVSALIYKCAVAARRSVQDLGSFKPTSLFQVTDMRQRLNPPLSQHACGNTISFFPVVTTNERDLNCPRLVSEIRKEKEKHRFSEKTSNYAIITQVANSLVNGNNNEHNNYIFTSLLAFPFYKVDFGWGRPARVGFATGPVNNFCLLLDDQTGGGVEAVVMLSKQEMSIFESDPELLEFAIPVPQL